MFQNGFRQLLGHLCALRSTLQVFSSKLDCNGLFINLSQAVVELR